MLALSAEKVRVRTRGWRSHHWRPSLHFRSVFRWRYPRSEPVAVRYTCQTAPDRYIRNWTGGARVCVSRPGRVKCRSPGANDTHKIGEWFRGLRDLFGLAQKFPQLGSQKGITPNQKKHGQPESGK